LKQSFHLTGCLDSRGHLFWQFIKDQLRWLNLKNLDELRKKIDEIIQSITPNQIASLTSFDFILTAIK